MALDVAPAHEQTRACYPDESGLRRARRRAPLLRGVWLGQADGFLLPTWSIMHSRQWKMQIPFLARHSRALTFDGRGSGRSDRPPDPEAYNAEEYIADVRHRDHGSDAAQRAVLVGFSRSGSTAIMQAAAHPNRTLGAFVIGASLAVVGPPPPQFQHFEDDGDTYAGWLKYNRHYWLRDYGGFVDFFMALMFVEPHSTEQFEDAVGWGLENDAETLILTRGTRTRTLEEAQEICRPCARAVPCPRRGPRNPGPDRQMSYTYAVALAKALKPGSRPVRRSCPRPAPPPSSAR